MASHYMRFAETLQCNVPSMRKVSNLYNSTFRVSESIIEAFYIDCVKIVEIKWFIKKLSIFAKTNKNIINQLKHKRHESKSYCNDVAPSLIGDKCNGARK